MTADYGYTCEKLFIAVECLATGAGDVRSRLYTAYLSALHLIEPADLPEEHRAEYKRIKERLTRHVARHQGEDAIQASLAKMRNRTGIAIAKKIFEIYLAVRRFDQTEPML
jgi:hypothetical protein